MKNISFAVITFFLLTSCTTNRPYYEKAYALYASDTDSALYYVNEHLLEMPEDGDGYYLKGYLLNQKGELLLAIDNYRKALSIYNSTLNEDRVVQVMKNMGNIYYDAGRYDLAIQNYLQIDEAYHDADWHLNIGIYYREYGEYIHALDHLLAAKRMYTDPYNLNYIFNELGVLYWDIKNYDDAIAYHENALRVSEEHAIGKDARSLNNLGNAYLYRGDTSQALTYFVLAADTPGDHLPATYRRLGDIYLATGNTSHAVAAFQQLNALDIAYRDLDEQLYSLNQLIKLVPDSASYFADLSLNISLRLEEHRNEIEKYHLQSSVHLIEKEHEQQLLAREHAYGIFYQYLFIGLMVLCIAAGILIYRGYARQYMYDILKYENDELKKTLKDYRSIRSS